MHMSHEGPLGAHTSARLHFHTQTLLDTIEHRRHYLTLDYLNPSHPLFELLDPLLLQQAHHAPQLEP